MAYKGSDLSENFRKFFKQEKKQISEILKSKGCTNIKLDYGFYYFYGFFTDAKGGFWYLSSGDVRNGYEKLLYRTAKSYSDYTGGTNQYIKVSDLKSWRL